MTADTSNTCWLRPRHWWQYRKVSVPPKQHRCSAPELPPSTHCATAAPCLAIWLRWWVSAVMGHLGIQFANKFGYKVAAIGRGSGNAALAKKLGARVYIDSKSTNAAEALQKLGGAQVILATAPSSKSMSELIDGLGPNGKLMVVGITFDPIEVTPVQLITGSRSIQGWAAGTPADSEDTLRFAELTGVRPMIETYPLEKADEAYARMMSGNAQFRVVLTM